MEGELVSERQSKANLIQQKKKMQFELSEITEMKEQISFEKDEISRQLRKSIKLQKDLQKEVEQLQASKEAAFLTSKQLHKKLFFLVLDVEKCIRLKRVLIETFLISDCKLQRMKYHC